MTKRGKEEFWFRTICKNEKGRPSTFTFRKDTVGDENTKTFDNADLGGFLSVTGTVNENIIPGEVDIKPSIVISKLSKAFDLFGLKYQDWQNVEATLPDNVY